MSWLERAIRGLPLRVEAGVAHEDQSGFERMSVDRRGGVLREFLGYLRHHKKWWLTPILLMLAVLGVFVVLGGTGAAPFIYTLF